MNHLKLLETGTFYEMIHQFVIKRFGNMMFANNRNIEYLNFYGSIFMKPNRERTEIVYDLNLKMKLVMILILSFEIIKNVILLELPMSNQFRYVLCDLLISLSDDDQRSLNFIIILAMSTYIIYLILLINLKKDKLVCWIDFLVVDDSLAYYAKKHNLTLSSAKKLFVTYRLFAFVTRCASLFYLLIVYLYYIRSFKLSLANKIDLKTMFLVFLPSAAIAVYSLSLYYVQATKCCTFFILFNLFQAEKLDKLSEDLINGGLKDKKRNFNIKHLFRFQNFLNNFKMSQIYFNYSNFSFLAPLFLTFVLYPYSLLKAPDYSIKALIGKFSFV